MYIYHGFNINIKFGGSEINSTRIIEKIFSYENELINDRIDYKVNQKKSLFSKLEYDF